MQTDPSHVIRLFQTDAPVTTCVPHTGGFINRSYLATDESGARYMLQRVSQAAFKNVPGLMDNFCRVTAYLSERVASDRECLHVVPARDGASFVRDAEGEYWRVIRFVEDSICLQTPETADDFYESAVALGTFTRLLSGFPAETLIETIPDFHHTPKRFRQFHDVIARDPVGRLAAVKEDVDFLLAREEDASLLQRMRDAGELPVRVTHNDAKIGNVLLDKQTRKGLCVIDLDTVMPGLIAYDFGEAVRSGASTGEEDEHDLSKVRLEPGLVDAFARGFIPACETLTKKEIETLPLGAMMMTLENGVRILGDYIAGDVYYSISYPDQNLYRARTQIKLLREYDRCRGELEDIILSHHRS